MAPVREPWTTRPGGAVTAASPRGDVGDLGARGKGAPRAAGGAAAGGASPPAAAPEGAAVELDGTLPRYVAYAFAHNPRVRAAYEDVRAQLEAPAIARRLPEPTVRFAGFVRAVETRVGPQRARLGVQQWFPWPSRLTRAGRAEAIRAEAALRVFEAEALDVVRAVTWAYAALWRIDRLLEVERRRVVRLRAVAASLRGRLAAGGARVADLARVETRVALAEDRIDALQAMRPAAQARLREAIGAPPDLATPMVPDPPPVGRPAEGRAALLAAAGRHPQVEALARRSAAERETARARRGERFPSFGVGVGWIVTGPSASDPAPPDSGKDAVTIEGMLRIPLWQRSYGAAERQARARARAFEARRTAALLALQARVDDALARVEDAARRVALYEGRLTAMAQDALASTQAAYAAQATGLADVLDAETDLVELERSAVEARTELAMAYADLEATVGRPVPHREVTP